MAFIIPIRRFRPHTEPMLTHAKSGHWYLSQAWTKALTWVWNERPLSKIAVERPYGDHREYQEYWWSLDIQDWSGARETYTTGKKAAWEGLGGSAWGVHPFKDITLTTTKKQQCLSLVTPQTCCTSQALWPWGDRVGCVHRWTEWPKCGLLGSANQGRSFSNVLFSSTKVPAKTL